MAAALLPRPRLFPPFPLLILALSTSHALLFHSSGPPPSLLLEDVVSEIARKERWDPEVVRISRFEEGSVGVGLSQRHEFQVRVGSKTLLVVEFPEEIGGSTWRKPRKREGERGWWWLDDPGRWPRPGLKSFDLEGPVEVKVSGDDRLSLLLPMNATHVGLKRVIVEEGIRIMVEGAEEVTLSYPSNSRLSPHRSLLTTEYGRKSFWLHDYSLCAPLLSVCISGSASLVAHKTHNAKAYVETAFLSSDIVQLLPEKCYSHTPQKDLSLSLFSIGSRWNLLARILRSILGKQISKLGTPHFLKAKIIPSTLVKFRLEMERDIGDNDRIWRKVPKWKTRPSVERDWFDVLTRVEVGTGLKPLSVRKLTRPIVAVDSMSWSSLLSNISLTQLQSVVVPPEALLLDVKW